MVKFLPIAFHTCNTDLALPPRPHHRHRRGRRASRRLRQPSAVKLMYSWQPKVRKLFSTQSADQVSLLRAPTFRLMHCQWGRHTRHPTSCLMRRALMCIAELASAVLASLNQTGVPTLHLCPSLRNFCPPTPQHHCPHPTMTLHMSKIQRPDGSNFLQKRRYPLRQRMVTVWCRYPHCKISGIFRVEVYDCPHMFPNLRAFLPAFDLRTRNACLSNVAPHKSTAASRRRGHICFLVRPSDNIVWQLMICNN